VSVEVRPAVQDDAAAIAEIRVRGWQVAYRGIIPQGYLDSMRPEADVDRRRVQLADSTRGDAVALADGRPAGWVAFGPYRDDDPPGRRPGEIYAVYVHPGRWRGGVGRALMDYAVAELTAQGYAPLVLWVLEDNLPARRFYERVGFRPDGGRHLFEVGGVWLPELRYRRARARGRAGRLARRHSP
jgi:GNAT superfamily N-acetyltransferase